MSIHAPDAPKPVQPKPGSYVVAFLILTAISVCILGAGLVAGTEPRMLLVRTGDGSFRVTGSNHFAGRQFYTKTIEGVTGVGRDNAVRDGRRDSAQENRKRSRELHLAFIGADGSKLKWDRESDGLLVEQFMRGKEPSLALAEPPPGWRMGLAWFAVAIGTLSFIGAIQSSFFPKKKPAQATPKP